MEESITETMMSTLKKLKKAPNKNINPVALVGLSNDNLLNIEFIQCLQPEVKAFLDNAVKKWNDGLPGNTYTDSTFLEIEDEDEEIEDYISRVLDRDDLDDLCDLYGLNDTNSGNQDWKPFDELMENSNNWLRIDDVEINLDDVLDQIQNMTLSGPPATNENTTLKKEEEDGDGVSDVSLAAPADSISSKLLSDKGSGNLSSLPSNLPKWKNLKTTPLLTTWHLAYNTELNLLVCLLCEEGVVFDHLTAHLASSERTVIEPKISRDGTLYGSNEKSVKTNHAAFPHTTTKKEEHFMDSIVTSLQADPTIRLTDRTQIINSKTRVDWIERTGIYNQRDQPVEGLAVDPMVSCNGLDGCNHVALKPGTLTNHRGRDHVRPSGNGSKSRNTPYDIKMRWVWGQRLSANKNAHAPCFHITGSYSPNVPDPEATQPPSLPSMDIDDIIAGMDTAFKVDIVQDVKATPLLGAYTETSVEAFISNLAKGSPRHLIKKQMTSTPHALDQYAPIEFRRLRHSLLRLFKEDAMMADPESPTKLNTSILHRITNVTSTLSSANQRRSPKRAFMAMKSATAVTDYIRFESSFFWSLFLLFHLHAQMKLEDRKKTNTVLQWYQIRPNSNIETCLQRLSKALSLPDETKHETALRSLMEVAYFPSDVDDFNGYQSGIANSPLLSFIAVQLLDDSGSYIHIHNIPPLLAKVCYCVRLRALYFINSDVKKKISIKAGNQWLDIANDFCVKHLASYGGGPFSIIREWMHKFSQVSFNTAREGVFRWCGNVLSSKASGSKIDFDDFVSRLRHQVFKTELSLLQDVFMQMFPSIEDLEKVFCLGGVVDSGSENQLGYGILSAGDGVPSNIHSKAFLQKLLSTEALGLNIRPQDRRLCLDIDLAEEWLQRVHGIWLMFAGLLHISIISGRGTEMLKHAIANSLNSRRHLFWDRDAGMARLDSDYHKGQNITGQHKHNSRYIPFELWRIMYLLIKVVRPVELLILRTARDLDDDASKTLGTIYYNHLFASNGQAWKENTYTNALGMVLEDVAGYHITLREWRQVAIAIQIKFLPSLQFSPPSRRTGKKTTDGNGDVEDAVHQLAGHTPRVAEVHYARQEEHGSSIASERYKGWNASVEYQTLLGFPITRDDAHKRPPIPSDLVIPAPKVSSLKKGKRKVQQRTKKPLLPPSTPPITRSKRLRSAAKVSDPRSSGDEISTENSDFDDESESEHSDWNGE